MRLCSTVPLPHPTSHLSDQGPWDTWKYPRPLSLGPLCPLLLFSSVAQTIPVPNASHLGLQGAQLASSRCCWGGGQCDCGGRLRN